MSMDLTDDKSTLVQVMAWCRQATSHYLSQCWPRSMSPHGVTRPQWVNHIHLCLFCSRTRSGKASVTVVGSRRVWSQRSLTSRLRRLRSHAWCRIWPSSSDPTRCRRTHGDACSVISLQIQTLTDQEGEGTWWDFVYYKSHPIPKLVLHLSLPYSMKPGVRVENKDVVGAAPTGYASTTSDWSTILLPTDVQLILQVLWYSYPNSDRVIVTKLCKWHCCSALSYWKKSFMFGLIYFTNSGIQTTCLSSVQYC